MKSEIDEMSIFSDNVEKNNGITVTSDFVEYLKERIRPDSIMIEVTIKNIDQMLGLKVEFRNPNQYFDCRESGTDLAFLDAMLWAILGKYEPLKNYDSKGKYVLTGENTKFDFFLKVLERYKEYAIAKIQGIEDSKKILEVDFTLGYRRKMKFYFSEKDMNVKKALIDAKLKLNE